MKLRAVAALGLTAALALTACGNSGEEASPTPSDNNTTQSTEGTTEETTEGSTEETTEGGNEGGADLSGLSGELTGMGASSMRVAQDAWTAAFMTATNNGVKMSYAAEGSGAGRGGMEDGSIQFGGSDRAFKMDENQAGNFKACTDDSIVLDLPIYISPIAVIFKLEGVETLNLDSETIAKIFKGDIAKWNDEAIAKHNEGVDLPDEFITVVHRSDDSGTTTNFTDYLSQTAPDVWDAEVSGLWPYEGGQPAAQTDGVKNAVASGNGTIGYVDASAADGVGVVHIGKDGKYFGPDAESAAKIVENSPVEEGRDEKDLAIALNREAEGYPVVLIAYGLVCQKYADDNTAELVKAYFNFITSAEGQNMAAENAGSAPLSDALREKVQASIDSINA